MSCAEDTEALAAQVPANPAAPTAPARHASPIAPAAPIIPPAPPAAPAGPVFALAPGQSNTVLDLSKEQDVKLCYKAMSPLTGEDRFDGTPGKVIMFLTTIQDRALNFGWSDILTIQDNYRVNCNIIQEYGHLTMLNMTIHAMAYIGQLTREELNAQMLYHFIIDSLTNTLRATFSCIKVTTRSMEHTMTQHSSVRSYHLPTLT